MIWESHYWKEDLLRCAERLARRQTQRRWPEASLVKVEHDVMHAAYSIRKLIEAAMLSDAVAGGRLTVRTFSSRGRPVTRMNWHHIDRLYALSRATSASISVSDLCNQIIHSYAFVLNFGEAGLHGFLVASDRDRRAKSRRRATD